MSHLTADQRTFDAWFRSQSPKQQAELRRGGVIPYREMPVDRYVFEVKPEAAAFMFDPWDEEMRKEEDTFVSREKLREIIGRILDTLSRSPDRSVRLHLELVRMAIKTTDALSNGEICASYGLTRQAVHYRVQEMRRVLFGRKVARKSSEKNLSSEKMSEKKVSSCQTPGKESLTPHRPVRVATHRVEKTRTSPRKMTHLGKSRQVVPKAPNRHGRKA